MKRYCTLRINKDKTIKYIMRWVSNKTLKQEIKKQKELYEKDNLSHKMITITSKKFYSSWYYLEEMK